MTRRKLSATLLCSAVAVALAACGTSLSPSAVRTTKSSATVASQAPQPTAAPAVTSTTAATSASAPPSGSVSSTGSWSATGTQALNQIEAQLGPLDNSLNAADTDLDDPQGDS